MAGLSVLVIDDEPHILQALRALLEKHGFRVRVAGCGRDGIAQFRAELPDLVILDAAMPVMDGYETLATLRSIAEGVPVLMMSGQTALEAALTQHEPPDAYLQKPARIQHILNTIRYLLGDTFAESMAVAG